MVDIATFSSLDIRIGRVTDVQDHDKAKKPMYKLTVDFGKEIGVRQIVAGIKPYYTREELLGRKIACIVNLDYKMIAGEESQGMLLAAGEGGDGAVALLVPVRDIQEGSRVH